MRPYLPKLESYPLIAAKYGVFTAGCFLLAYGTMMTVQARLGLGSWSVLHQGLSTTFSITFGQATQAASIVILGLGWLLGVRPSLATFINSYMVGYFCDVILRYGSFRNREP